MKNLRSFHNVQLQLLIAVLETMTEYDIHVLNVTIVQVSFGVVMVVHVPIMSEMLLLEKLKSMHNRTTKECLTA